MENNNEQKIKEAVLECNGKWQGIKYDLEHILYCPLIPLLLGKEVCKYQSGKTTKIIERDNGKNYEVPRYLCSWKNQKREK